LIGEKRVAWLELVSLLVPIALNENEDVFVWNLHKNGLVLVYSLYKDTMTREGILEKLSF